VLSHVSWATYESLLADYSDTRTPRFTYSEGMLEIMSPTAEHEKLNRDSRYDCLNWWQKKRELNSRALALLHFAAGLETRHGA